MSNSAPITASPKLRWFQFSLRTLFVLTTLVACGCGWFGWKVERAKKEHAAVLAITVTRGRYVFYNYQIDADGKFHLEGDSPRPTPSGPDWLRKFLPLEFFNSVSLILVIDGNPYVIRGNPISVADLEHLKEMTQLKALDLTLTHVANAEVAKLQAALPECHICHH